MYTKAGSVRNVVIVEEDGTDQIDRLEMKRGGPTDGKEHHKKADELDRACAA